MPVAQRTREAILVGGAVAGGLVFGLVVAEKLVGPVRTQLVPTTMPPGTEPGLIPGITITPQEIQPPASAQPTSSTSAPAVTNLTATPLQNGTTTLNWTGTLVTEWPQPDGTVADNIGYDLYERRNGSWVIVQAEVYPPLKVSGLHSGDVLGIAPVYVKPDGTVVGGRIVSVTVQ